jgi:hypothetical protein
LTVIPIRIKEMAMERGTEEGAVTGAVTEEIEVDKDRIVVREVIVDGKWDFGTLILFKMILTLIILN